MNNVASVPFVTISAWTATSGDERDLQLKSATRLTAQGFGCEDTPELRRDVEQHVTGQKLLFKIALNGVLVGYAVFYTVCDGTVLYLSGIMIEPNAQGNGIAQLVIEHARRETGTKYLALRTASPRMWRAGAKVCPGSWHPHALDALDDEMHALGNRVAKAIGCEQLGLNSGFYGHDLYGERPTHRVDAFQDWWETICPHPEKGDAVVCIGKFPL